MEDLSLHILDIVQNSLAASASEVKIVILEDTIGDRLEVEIEDDGHGMDENTRKKALDPFFTTRSTRRVGLGLPLLAQAARESGGSFDLSSTPGRGTSVRAVFQLSHPDRKPLGDLAGTLGVVLAGKRDLDLLFEYRKNAKLVASLDTRRRQKSITR
jgi:signal transduction histidine kinase